jgi:hypothetical protein
VGRLTEDMTRLCEEIQTLRADREDLKKEVAEETKARQVEVLGSCAAFAEALARKAKGAHQTRMAFLGNLKHSVAAQTRGVREDLETVRRVWGRRPSA